MSQNNDKDRINNEISVYKTSNKLLAFSDRMNVATAMNYATLHSKGEDGEIGRRIYSTIGILASDFSAGKGDANKRAEANISPSEARYIFAKIQAGIGHLTEIIFESSKIFGNADAQGYAPMRILKIARQHTDQAGEVKKYPWTISVSNGRAIKVMGQNGSSYAKGGTYQSQKEVMINLNDQDFYCLMTEVIAFIDVWEVTFGAKVIREGRAILDVKMAEAALEAERNPKPKKEYQAPRSAPTPQISTSQITLEQAKGIVVQFGTKKGMTLGEIEAERKGGAAWYITAKSSNDELRAAAQVVANAG